MLMVGAVIFVWDASRPCDPDIAYYSPRACGPLLGAFCGLPLGFVGLIVLLAGFLRGVSGDARRRRRLTPLWPVTPAPRYCQVCGSDLVYDSKAFGRCRTCGEVRWPPPGYR